MNSLLTYCELNNLPTESACIKVIFIISLKNLKNKENLWKQTI